MYRIYFKQPAYNQYNIWTTRDHETETWIFMYHTERGVVEVKSGESILQILPGYPRSENTSALDEMGIMASVAIIDIDNRMDYVISLCDVHYVERTYATIIYSNGNPTTNECAWFQKPVFDKNKKQSPSPPAPIRGSGEDTRVVVEKEFDFDFDISTDEILNSMFDSMIEPADMEHLQQMEVFIQPNELEEIHEAFRKFYHVDEGYDKLDMVEAWQKFYPNPEDGEIAM